jgi:SAM-dependent methyltransferase
MGIEKYAGATFVESKAQPHLGGNIREGDPFTYCPVVWSYVVERFCINSVMDLGSGVGNAANYFYRKLKIQTIAIEGLVDNVQNSVFPAICHDLTKGPVVTKVDLVHCQEVAEHLDEKYLPNLLDTLACGRVILMTHALPGEEGHHHVNLKASDYWVQKVTERGYNLLVEDTNRIRLIAGQERAIFMQSSGLLFHRK